MNLSGLLKAPFKIVYRIFRNLKNFDYRRKNHNHDFTIICQNCLAGIIYSQLGMKFLSPTINMFIEDENFIKLVYNFKHYMSVEPEAITDRYVDPIDPNVVYPKIKIDDIEVCCLHYRDCDEAIEAWNRRRVRVNFKNVFVIGNAWNMHFRRDLIDRLCSNPYKTVVFTLEDYSYENCLKLPEIAGGWRIDKRGVLRPDIMSRMPHSYLMYYEKFFDFVFWLNEDTPPNHYK